MDSADIEDKAMFTFTIDWIAFSALVWIILGYFNIGGLITYGTIGLIFAIFAPLLRAMNRRKHKEEKPDPKVELLNKLMKIVSDEV